MFRGNIKLQLYLQPCTLRRRTWSASSR